MMKALRHYWTLIGVGLAVALSVVIAAAEETQDATLSEALPAAESATEAVGLLCPAAVPCKLDLGTAFGNPWLNAADGDVGYFEVSATPQLQPSEIIVTLAHGTVATYARSRGQEPTKTNYDWKGGRVLHLPGWSVPHEGDTLVIMVEATSLDARYRVLAASNEDILPLDDGLPVQMSQLESEMRYFSIAVQDNATDLLLSLDAQYGDPDMYVSLADPEGRFLPTKQNFTWQALSFGADALQMQSEALSKYCAPGTEANEVCTYNIGVLANSDCSYTIKASLNSGWKHPLQLLLGHPQSSFVAKGSFDYYSLLVPRQGDDNEPWESIVLTLTPKYGGQQDVYITTNSSREPGPKDYDVKSNNWGGSSALVFSETAPGFCTDCTIYVGVYGYTGGVYSIVASQGLTRLLEGFPQQGSVGGDTQKPYYEFFNPPGELKPIQVVVTALTGDPDVYVTVGGSDFPGPHNFYWMGGATGTDFIEMLPSDEHFCQDCVYEIGLTSASNSSFTVAVTRGDEGATHLVHGRPQAGVVSAGGVRYYVVRPDSDTTRLTVSLTLSSGSGDLFMTTMDGDNTTTIDPMDNTTYSWTSRGLAGDTIVAQGEGSGTGSPPYLVGVAGATAARFSVTATFSQGVSLLQAGVPQRHTLEAGKSMSFGFLVDEDDEDLQLTLTPVRGDVALYAGMGVTPSCEKPRVGDMGEVVIVGDGDEDKLVCSGWTWSSTSGIRRDIFISSLHPCDAQGDGDDGDANDNVFPPGESSKVDVSDTCTPASFGVGMMFMTVAVQGTSDAHFSIMASLVGKHVMLITGVLQHAVTSPMIPCGSSIPTENGPCSPKSEASRITQEALFVFRVGSGSVSTTIGFTLSLLPECPAGSCAGGANATCPIGCPPRPAKAYVNSCLDGMCKPGDRFPSQDNAQRAFEVSTSHGSIFVDDKLGSSGNGVLCVPPPPMKDGKLMACVYYIAVTAGGVEEPPMQLTAIADIPRGVTLVAPCIGDESLPDGMIVTSTSHLPGSGMKLFELCSEGVVDFQISIENCRGDADLLVCDDRCPEIYPNMEESQYSYMSNGRMACTIPPGGKSPQCEPLWREAQNEVSVTVNGAAAGGSTFFVGVGMRRGQRAQDQEHILKVILLGEGGVHISPVLSAKPLPSASEGTASRAFVQGGKATVEWGGATLHTPKYSGEHAHDAEDRDCGDYCTFEVFAVPTRYRGDFPETPCGLESLRGRFSNDVVYSYVGLAKVSKEVTQSTLQGLKDERHDIFVVATCDFMCLEALLRMQCSRTIGMAKTPCKSQVVVFPAAELVKSTSALSGDSSSSSSSDGHDGGSSSLRSLVVLMAAALVVVGGITFALVRAGGDNSSGGAGGWGAAWAWLVGGGGSGSGRLSSMGAGFELTDLQRRGGGAQGPGGDALLSDGLGDFVVGDRGRGADAVEAGPGYTSLLAGQDR